MSNKLSIGIDCEPFTPRPDVYFEQIWTNILKRPEPIPSPVSKCFGAWEWRVDPFTKDQYDQIMEYLTNIYNEGFIRGAFVENVN